MVQLSPIRNPPASARAVIAWPRRWFVTKKIQRRRPQRADIESAGRCGGMRTLSPDLTLGGAGRLTVSKFPVLYKRKLGNFSLRRNLLRGQLLRNVAQSTQGKGQKDSGRWMSPRGMNITFAMSAARPLCVQH